MNGGFIGCTWESPILLSLMEACRVLFGASAMGCVRGIPSALYTQTIWPLLYVGKVFILHHLQRNAYLIS